MGLEAWRIPREFRWFGEASQLRGVREEGDFPRGPSSRNPKSVLASPDILEGTCTSPSLTLNCKQNPKGLGIRV